jgi:hypothetical protein
MMTKALLPLAAAGMVSVLVLGTPNLADATHYARHQRHEKARHQAARQEIRQNWGEIRNDRAELRRDRVELARDRADLRRLSRQGASREVINNKRKEIHQDLREIAQDRGELRDDYAELRRDRARYGYGNDGRFGSQQDWNRREYTSRWGRDDRWGNRDRWGWDYGRD